MTLESIVDDAEALLPDIIELQRALHRNPEVGLELPGTRTLVLEAIADLPLEVTEHETTGGIVAVLRGESDGPTVLLRGDMDGLPLREDTGLEYASVNGDTMHACGHDLHTAMLVGAARLLSGRLSEIAGAVMFMFQPGEEGFGGAKFMLDEGMLDSAGARPELALAIHVTTFLESGMIAGRSGPMMASADQLDIVVSGAGGHAARPDAANDPVAAAAEIVMSVQSAVTRNISVFDPAVCTFTSVEAGNAHNIIPDQVRLRGTIRALSADTRSQMHELVARVADGVSVAHGMTARTTFDHGYPVTVNDAKATSELMRVAQLLVGSDRVVTLADPSMGAEDFSYVLEEIPGALFFLGACPPDLTPETSPFNHSNLVRFDEQAMATGIAFHAAVALGRLG